MLELEGLRLEHGELGDSGKHLSGELSCSRLVLVNFLCHLQCRLSAVEGLRTKLFSQVANLFEDELFLKKGLFFVVKALLEDVNFCEKSLLVWVLTWKVNGVRMVAWVFKLFREGLDLGLLGLKLFVYIDHFLG